MLLNHSITDVAGIKVGHAQNRDALTGCTVIICEKGAVGGISQRGGAPGTRETDLLKPMRLVQKVHAIMLSGGSAFGLDAAAGVMAYLEENKIGYKTTDTVVPIVPAAILYDLSIGDASVRPEKSMGYNACQNASTDNPQEGNWGAGTGATVGKIFGMRQAMKGGIGTSSRDLGAGITLGAIAAVNAFGDIVDYQNRKIIAGARKLLKKGESQFADTLDTMKSRIGRTILSLSENNNTIIGAIATNATLIREEAIRLAESASDGIALTVQPAFSIFDGDTVFSLATCKKKGNINMLCAYAPFVFADAILSAVRNAEAAGGLPAISDELNTG
jgi:L-aminopeptidase/D-esterase-like protein